MTPHYTDPWLTVYAGDCRDVLPTLPADSVDCVVTSPPYWGLRDYGTATWIGGDEGCDHTRVLPISSMSTLGTTGHSASEAAMAKRDEARRVAFGSLCGKCGATRQDSQLGLEPTPEEYVGNLVAVFREVRRVLKPSGTCWLNLGDSYTHNTETHPSHNGTDPKMATSARARIAEPTGVRKSDATGLRSKNLVGIPWRVAFALQADGWYLRSDIIWSKPNPMPESVTDRPTKAHEYLFLLTKSSRYFFDASAVREPEKPWNKGRMSAAAMDGYQSIRDGYKERRPQNDKQYDTIKGANLRSVWTIATRPYADAHFAVFPPELPERCIKAGSSERGVCPECGAPWERVVERTGADMVARYDRGEPTRHGMNGAAASKASNVGAFTGIRSTNGWLSACKCGASAAPAPLEAVPAVILDPFAGSGTVGLVANRLSRRAILIDLNPDYLRQQMRRNAQTPLGLSS